MTLAQCIEAMLFPVLAPFALIGWLNDQHVAAAMARKRGTK